MLLVQITSDERSSFQLSLIQAGWHLSLPPRIAAARSFICSDHVCAEQEHRLHGVLLVQGPQVLQKEPAVALELFFPLGGGGLT